MYSKSVFLIFTFIFSFELTLRPAQGLSQAEYKAFQGLVDPTSGDNCDNDAVLQSMCNKAARKKGAIGANESLAFFEWFPRCENMHIVFDDLPGIESKIYVLKCCSSNSPYFSITKGQSKYGAYEYQCQPDKKKCIANGNIGSVFV